MLRNLLARWQEITFEKKLTMFIAPIFVAVASGLILAGLTGSDDSAPQTETEALQIVNLAVTGGSERQPTIDVTVRNTGNTVAVVTGVVLTVLETAVLPLCEGGNPLVPTREYPFGLPAQPSPGASVAIPVSQQVAADEADRFTIPLTGGDPSGTEVELLHVAVGVLHDAHPTPLSAGMAVVALPGPPAEPFFTIDAPGVPVAGCYAENQATMRHFLALEGARDLALDDALPGE